ncbi:LacI family DNA-binding transcriptional regulator [Yimella sp. cx-51]|uniref:LacI family DNA-binding transcriptional regulator n=1 Tax=Yimella sp. cx-51 TaxID=2770551 RepID=UPI00165D9C72|nr:LacI family DNA-binding transcriptional regulator [Yimella sp. cx-51]MBC9958051.1 LacI family DNA-binding transcriptional regulator [Yimella sp. cx-51]QTH38168.1 LacI family DNA-binding transcriptional regulator [Yimella sp. cx-51]
MSNVGSRVTVRDVAQRARVSKATAARVLGGYGPASDSVREAVLTAAKELGYRTNFLARSMATGQSRTIGVILGDIENPFFGRAARGITDVASAAGVDVIIANTDEQLSTERSLVDVLVGKQVDGLILSPTSSTDTKHVDEIAYIPTVFMDRRPTGTSAFDSVVTDNVAGGELLGAELRRNGHRDIVFITSAMVHSWKPGDPIQISSVTDRVAGLERSLQRQVDLHPNAINADAVKKILDEVLTSSTTPTAIVASDSVIALHAFNDLRSRGIAIGRDVSLCSFDNAVWTSVTDPGVTVIDQPMYEIGRRAAELLFARVAGDEDPPRHEVLPVSLVQRGSIATL